MIKFSDQTLHCWIDNHIESVQGIFSTCFVFYISLLHAPKEGSCWEWEIGFRHFVLSDASYGRTLMRLTYWTVEVLTLLQGREVRTLPELERLVKTGVMLYTAFH